MNRLVAAAAAGALALAALPTPDAAAQDLPKETTDASGETFYLNDEGTHYVTDIQEAAQPYAELDSTQQEKAVAIADAAVAGLIETGIIREANVPAPSLDDDTTTPTETTPPSETASAPVAIDQTTVRVAPMPSFSLIFFSITTSSASCSPAKPRRPRPPPTPSRTSR